MRQVVTAIWWAPLDLTWREKHKRKRFGNNFAGNTRFHKRERYSTAKIVSENRKRAAITDKNPRYAPEFKRQSLHDWGKLLPQSKPKGQTVYQ